MSTIEDRISRIEVLMGLAPVPQSWGITAERVLTVSLTRACSLYEAKRALIENFGEPLPEERSAVPEELK